ncbi:MAG: DUF2282 domain-containing protein [Gammaproteobacteria bacterium]|nr:DUF2282 domain-containing protein [Gammaproteobacteria bacterium]
MNKIKTITAATIITGLTALSVASIGNAADQEKCYGVAKAGKNDCATKTSSCAGTSTENSQSDAFIVVPGGLCERLAGGSLESM